MEILEDSYCSGQKNLLRTNLDACHNGLITLERLGICPGGKKTTLSMKTYRNNNRQGGNRGSGCGGSSWGGGGHRLPSDGGGSGDWNPSY
jgi:hypothetical protein